MGIASARRSPAGGVLGPDTGPVGRRHGREAPPLAALAVRFQLPEGSGAPAFHHHPSMKKLLVLASLSAVGAVTQVDAVTQADAASAQQTAAANGNGNHVHRTFFED